jgi:hypothetical protein
VTSRFAHLRVRARISSSSWFSVVVRMRLDASSERGLRVEGRPLTQISPTFDYVPTVSEPVSETLCKSANTLFMNFSENCVCSAMHENDRLGRGWASQKSLELLNRKNSSHLAVSFCS